MRCCMAPELLGRVRTHGKLNVVVLDRAKFRGTVFGIRSLGSWAEGSDDSIPDLILARS